MNSSQNFFFSIGCISAALGVAAGAFGAHGLKATLSPEMLSAYETAVRYQMYHAFGLIVVGWAVSRSNDSKVRIAGWCFVFGTLLFSGSLYALTLSDIRWLGAITPLGGVAFIAGWLALAFSVLQRSKS